MLHPLACHSRCVTRRSTQLGFSLIELGVTLAVLGILLGLAAPNWADWQAGRSIRSSANTISNALTETRLEAIKRNAAVAYVLADETGPKGQICLWVAGACGTVLGGDGKGVRDVVVKSGPTLAAATANGAPPIVFNGFGQVINNVAIAPIPPAVILINAPGANAQRMAVVISGMSVRTCNPNIVDATVATACPTGI